MSIQYLILELKFRNDEKQDYPFLIWRANVLQRPDTLVMLHIVRSGCLKKPSSTYYADAQAAMLFGTMWLEANLVTNR